ncbi:MAG: hypothetical protein AAF218_02475 [Pseudomonadota bacterium]
MQHVVFAAIIAILPCAAYADMTDFGPGTQLGRVTTAAPLEGPARRTYAHFRSQMGYFGAFAASPSTGATFWIRNFYDAGTARAAAVQGCAVLSGTDDCEIYAIMMPETLPLDQSQATGLSAAARDGMATVYQENREPGKFAAFAISGANHYGYAKAWDSAEAARDTALAYCQRGVARDMAEIRPEGRAWVRARGMDTCRVIDVEQTPE